jgi:hypothetical protein
MDKPNFDGAKEELAKRKDDVLAVGDAVQEWAFKAKARAWRLSVARWRCACSRFDAMWWNGLGRHDPMV